MKKEQLLTDLSDAQCEKVVGGVGRLGGGLGFGAGAGTRGWVGNGALPPGLDAHGLAGAGFTAGDMNQNSAVGVMVPGPKDG
jgi:hypothetical protein